jgi:hypothetical protein
VPERDDLRRRGPWEAPLRRSSFVFRIEGVRSNVTEDVVREVALPSGMVDVKVCAVDEVWSGLQLVIRRSNRKPPAAP